MKKLKHENELLKEAMRVGSIYFKKRGAGEFDPTDSANDKMLALYRLLVNDQLIQPLAREHQNDLPHIRHKLALWISRQLPANHPLLQE